LTVLGDFVGSRHTNAILIFYKRRQFFPYFIYQSCSLVAKVRLVNPLLMRVHPKLPSDQISVMGTQMILRQHLEPVRQQEAFFQTFKNFTAINCLFLLLFHDLLFSACVPNPCLNGGSCQLDIDSPDGFACKCPPQFSGSKCESKIYLYDICTFDHQISHSR